MLALRSLSASSSSIRTFSTSSSARLAKLNLIGRLGATPTVAKDKAGKDILIYSVATTDRITGASAGSDGSRPEPQTTWHRVLQYNTTDAMKDYLGNLPGGTLVHIEADFKKRTIKDEAGNFSDQTLNLLKSIEVLSKPKTDAADASAPAAN